MAEEWLGFVPGEPHFEGTVPGYCNNGDQCIGARPKYLSMQGACLNCGGPFAPVADAE